MARRVTAEAVRNHLRTRWYVRRYRGTATFAPGFHARGALGIGGGGRVEIGRGVFVDRPGGPTRIHVAPGATVRIGDGCYLNGLTIDAAADVTIGPRCLLGDAHILTNSYHATRADRHGVEGRVAPVVIGENVWLAGQSAVLPGVRIGDDSVVGFRSVITEDVESGVVVSSHAQRVVRRL